MNERPYELILCPWCEVYWPVDHFGIVRARRSGRNLYCKECNRRKVAAARANNPERKPTVFSRVVLTPQDKVKQAISNGAHTRSAIQRRTGLTMDQVVDCLAVLAFDRRVLKSEVVNGERYWVAA